jgi:hypothetical protein
MLLMLLQVDVGASERRSLPADDCFSAHFERNSAECEMRAHYAGVVVFFTDVTCVNSLIDFTALLRSILVSHIIAHY